MQPSLTQELRERKGDISPKMDFLVNYYGSFGGCWLYNLFGFFLGKLSKNFGATTRKKKKKKMMMEREKCGWPKRRRRRKEVTSKKMDFSLNCLESKKVNLKLHFWHWNFWSLCVPLRMVCLVCIGRFSPLWVGSKNVFWGRNPMVSCLYTSENNMQLPPLLLLLHKSFVSSILSENLRAG